MRVKKLILFLVLAIVVAVPSALSVCWYRDYLAEFPDEEEDVSYRELRVSVPVSPVVLASAEDFHESVENAPSIADIASINSEFFCYLDIPGAGVSYPVVLGANNKYYLTHNYYRQESASGCLFVDVDTVNNGYCTVIHGHNMGSGRDDMFSSLIRYQSAEFCADNPVFCLMDADGVIRTYRIFSAFNLETTVENAFQYRRSDFLDNSTRREFFYELVSRSMYDCRVDDGEYPELVILSTCNRQYGAGNRFLVCGGLVSTVS